MSRSKIDKSQNNINKKIQQYKQDNIANDLSMKKILKYSKEFDRIVGNIYCTTLKECCPIAKDLVKSAREETDKKWCDMLGVKDFNQARLLIKKIFKEQLEIKDMLNSIKSKQGAK